MHDRKESEQALLDNAAKRLDVTPQKLRDALAAAQDDQIEKAVENGDLTQEQAGEIKKRREQSGTVLGPGGKGPMMLHRKRTHGMHGPVFRLFSDLAKAEGKSLADVRSAVRASARTRADKAVDEGDLTRKQADALLEHLDQRLENLDKLPRWRSRGHDRFRGAPGGPDVKPGGYAPAPEGPPGSEGQPVF